MRAATWTLVSVVACAATALAAGCGEQEDGDCTIKISFQGDVYRAVNTLQVPRRGEGMGQAGYADCEGDIMPENGLTDVYAVAGEDPADVVLILGEGGSDIVYINEGIPYRKRPAILKEGSRFLACTERAKFTGSWGYIDPVDMPNMEEYDSAEVPYTGVFKARRGQGLSLDRWSEVTLEAEITADTYPVPNPEFLENVLAGDLLVRVTTRCRGKAFEVTSIRLLEQ